MNVNYDQYSLGSMFNLVPPPKIILFLFSFTRYEAPSHELSSDQLNQTSFRKTLFLHLGLLFNLKKSRMIISNDLNKLQMVIFTVQCKL